MGFGGTRMSSRPVERSAMTLPSCSTGTDNVWCASIFIIWQITPTPWQLRCTFYCLFFHALHKYEWCTYWHVIEWSSTYASACQHKNRLAYAIFTQSRSRHQSSLHLMRSYPPHERNRKYIDQPKILLQLKQLESIWTTKKGKRGIMYSVLNTIIGPSQKVWVDSCKCALVWRSFVVFILSYSITLRLLSCKFPKVVRPSSCALPT